MTNLLHRYDEFVTVHNESSKILQCAVQLVCKDRVLFVGVDLHVSLCGQQHPKYKRGISSRVSTFVFENCSSSDPTNKNLTELGL